MSKTLLYRKPKITEKKLSISFFLKNNHFNDSMGFFLGNVVYAGSSVDDSSGENDSGSSNCTF